MVGGWVTAYAAFLLVLLLLLLPRILKRNCRAVDCFPFLGRPDTVSSLRGTEQVTIAGVAGTAPIARPVRAKHELQGHLSRDVVEHRIATTPITTITATAITALCTAWLASSYQSPSDGGPAEIH